MFRPGQMVGLYTLIVRLGRGGFGEVWLKSREEKFSVKQADEQKTATPEKNELEH